MWKLTIENDEGAIREVDLVREGYSVGRDGACDIYLPERNVSRRHARLERDGEGHWWLVDLGAPYGSFVNGRRVEGRTQVAPGDLMQVGDHWLGLVGDGVVPEGEGPAAGGDEASPGGERPSLPWGVRVEPDRLFVLEGPDGGRQVRLDGAPVLIGVGEGVTIRLPDGVAPEGVHALVRPLPLGRYELVRRGEAVRLWAHMQPTGRALLDDGDLVRFEAGGSQVMAIRFGAERRVRHGAFALFDEPSPRPPSGRGQRLDPAALPQPEAIAAELAALPLWWRLEGESVWPRPEGYRAPPLRFTDVTSELAASPTLPPPDGEAYAMAASSTNDAGPSGELALPTNDAGAPSEPAARAAGPSSDREAVSAVGSSNDREAVNAAGPSSEPAVNAAGPASEPAASAAGPASDRAAASAAGPASEPAASAAGPASEPAASAAGPASDRAATSAAGPASDRAATSAAGPASEPATSAAGPASEPATERAAGPGGAAVAPLGPGDEASAARRRRGRREALALVAALLLVGGAWALVRTGGEAPAAGGTTAAGRAADRSAAPAAGVGPAHDDQGDSGGVASAAVAAPPSASAAAARPSASSAPRGGPSTAASRGGPPALGPASAKRPPVESDAARLERCKYLGLPRCN
ncbi:MAG TPA: FHA domain-containing protein [Polyangiaceae bacterium]|nr:FHA domain-containing protein [Polyangiaceae bacterium]